MSFNIDVAIFIVFLLINFALGVYGSMGVESMRSYAIGNRNFSTPVITATIVATWIGGSFFTINASKSYTDGLYYIIPAMGDIIAFLSVGYIFAPRMGEFLGNFSVAESMGKIYGQGARVLIATSDIFITIGVVAMQFKVASTLLNHFFGLSGITALILTCTIVTLYSAFGGIKSVTFTDVVQFFTFGALIPSMALLIWGTLDSPHTVVDMVAQNPIFDYDKVMDTNNPKFWGMLTLFILFIIPGFDPPLFQRISMSRNTSQASRSYALSAMTLLVIYLLIFWIAILLLSSNREIEPDNLLAYVVANYATYPGFKGFVLIGVMAMIMSTADSYMNSSAVLFSHDFCKPLGISGKMPEILLSKIFAVFVGIFGVILALYTSNLFDLLMLLNSYSMPVTVVPFIMTVLGFRSTLMPLLIAMFSGLMTTIFWERIFVGSPIYPVIPAMMANALAFMASHYILRQPGGWIGVHDTAPLIELREERKKKIKGLVDFIKNFNFIDFCYSNTPRAEHIYSLFGLFCIVSVFSTMYSIPSYMQQTHDKLLELVYHTVLVSSTVLLTYPVWPSIFKSEKFIAVFWNIAVPYILVFTPALLVIISNFGQFQLMVLLVNIIILSILLRWQVATFMIICSIVLSAQFYKWFSGVPIINAEVDIGLQFKIMYMLLLISSILIGFLKPAQEMHRVTKEKVTDLGRRISERERELKKAFELKNEFIHNVTHEYHAPMTGVISMAQMLSEDYDKLTDEMRRMAADTILKSTLRLSHFDENITSLSKLSVSGKELNIEKLNLSSIVREQVNKCKSLYANLDRQIFMEKIEPGIEIEGDNYYIRQTLDNLIINSIQYCQAGNISIELKGTKEEAIFMISDEGIGIPKEEIYDIFGTFVVSSRTRSPSGGRGIGLALCKKVIDVHHGGISAYSDGVKGARFEFRLRRV